MASRDGMPVGHVALPGGTVDVEALVREVEVLRQRLPCGRPVLVFDRGLVSEERLRELSEDGWRYIAAVGRTSGREFEKFAKFQVATEKPLKIKSPILKDAYVAYECKLVEHHTYGDHEWFVGEVVAVHYLKEALDERGVLNLDKIKPAFYLGEDLYAEMKKVAIHHIGRKEVLEGIT
jgi:transposase